MTAVQSGTAAHAEQDSINTPRLSAFGFRSRRAINQQREDSQGWSGSASGGSGDGGGPPAQRAAACQLSARCLTAEGAGEAQGGEGGHSVTLVPAGAAEAGGRE
jgi:hypothetical protein